MVVEIERMVSSRREGMIPRLYRNFRIIAPPHELSTFHHGSGHNIACIGRPRQREFPCGIQRSPEAPWLLPCFSEENGVLGRPFHRGFTTCDGRF